MALHESQRERQVKGIQSHWARVRQEAGANLDDETAIMSPTELKLYKMAPEETDDTTTPLPQVQIVEIFWPGRPLVNQRINLSTLVAQINYKLNSVNFPLNMYNVGGRGAAEFVKCPPDQLEAVREKYRRKREGTLQSPQVQNGYIDVSDLKSDVLTDDRLRPVVPIDSSGFRKVFLPPVGKGADRATYRSSRAYEPSNAIADEPIEIPEVQFDSKVDPEEQEKLIAQLTPSHALSVPEINTLLRDALRAGIVLNLESANRLLINTSSFVRDIILPIEIKAVAGFFGSEVIKDSSGGLHFVGTPKQESSESKQENGNISGDKNEREIKEEEPRDPYEHKTIGNLRDPENMAKYVAQFEAVRKRGISLPTRVQRLEKVAEPSGKELADTENNN